MPDTIMTDTSRQDAAPSAQPTPGPAKPVPAAPAGTAPWHPIADLRREVDRLFEEAGSLFGAPWGRLPTLAAAPWFRASPPALVPPAEVTETDGAYKIALEMPGLDENAVSVSLREDVLTISAEKTEEMKEEGENRHIAERSYGFCTRSFRLPADADAGAIAAILKNGVLTITVPRAAPAKEATRTIPVTPA